MKNTTEEYFYAALKHCFATSPFKTQKDLAKEAGVALSSINEAFKGKKAGTKLQEKIAKAFDFELVDFLMQGKILSLPGGEAKTEFHEFEKTPYSQEGINQFKDPKFRSKLIQDLTAKLKDLDTSNLKAASLMINSLWEDCVSTKR